MIAMGDNVKQNQMLVDILERCVIQLGILVAQGQKGGPLTTQEYIQTQLDIWQVIEKMHVTQQEHRQFSEWRETSHRGRPSRWQHAASGRIRRRLLRKASGSPVSG